VPGGASFWGLAMGTSRFRTSRRFGGIAVAVASDEAARSGKPDAWKPDRLIGAGGRRGHPRFQRGIRALLDCLSFENAE